MKRVFSLLIALSSALVAQTASDVQVILSDAGLRTPLAGMAVVLSWQGPLPAPDSGFLKVPLILHASTAASGVAEFKLVRHGTYRICATGREYLDPCQWGPESTVAVSSANRSFRLGLTSGVPVAVTIADPAKRLPTRPNVVPDSAFSPFVVSASRIIGKGGATFPLVARLDGVHEYGGIVPTDIDLAISVGGSTLRLVDSARRPLSGALTLRARLPQPAAPRLIPGLSKTRLGALLTLSLE